MRRLLYKADLVTLILRNVARFWAWLAIPANSSQPALRFSGSGFWSLNSSLKSCQKAGVQ